METRSKKQWTVQDVEKLLEVYPLDREAPESTSQSCSLLAEDMGRTPGSLKWKWYDLRQEKEVSKDPVRNALSTFQEVIDENKALKKENAEFKKKLDFFVNLANAVDESEEDDEQEPLPGQDIVVNSATGEEVMRGPGPDLSCTR